MKSICVYCGSASGNSLQFKNMAIKLAEQLVLEKCDLVYGGGDIGLMKVIADEVMRLGGHVTGVIPRSLMDREVGHLNLSQLHIVANMHERKALMAELSDGFVAMPGGIGTLEEMFEMFTWLQLGFHQKPLGLLNVDGFYDHLLRFLDHAVSCGFLRPEHNDLLIKSDQPLILLSGMRNFKYPTSTA